MLFNRGSGGWNLYLESAPISRFTLHRDRSLMHVDDPLRDGKAESGAPEGVTPRFIDAVKNARKSFSDFQEQFQFQYLRHSQRRARPSLPL